MAPYPIAPFWDRAAGAVVLAIRSDDLPAAARSVVVQSRAEAGTPGRFLGEVRLAGAVSTDSDSPEPVTYFLLVRPEREPPFTLELLLAAEGPQLRSWQALTFADPGDMSGPVSPRVAAYVLKEEDGLLTLLPDAHPAAFEDVRTRAARAGAVSLFAAPVVDGRYGPALPVSPATASLHVLPLLRQRDAQERQRLEAEVQGLPEERRRPRAKELELNLPDEWMNLYVGPFATEAGALAALERLEFGIIRNNFAPTPDPANPRAARIGKLRGKHLSLRAWSAGNGHLIRARFRELAYLDRVYVVTRDDTVLKEWDTGAAGTAAPVSPAIPAQIPGEAPGQTAGRAIAYVFCGDRVLRDTRPLDDHDGARQSAEQLALGAVQSAGTPPGSIAATVFALFTQELQAQEPQLLASLEQAAAIFGLSPHREADVIGHANLFLGLHSRGARERLLAAARGQTGASPEGGAMAILREALRREMPDQAQQAAQWLAGQADAFHPLWRAFIAGQDFAAHVTCGALLAAEGNEAPPNA